MENVKFERKIGREGGIFISVLTFIIKPILHRLPQVESRLVNEVLNEIDFQTLGNIFMEYIQKTSDAPMTFDKKYHPIKRQDIFLKKIKLAYAQSHQPLREMRIDPAKHEVNYGGAAFPIGVLHSVVHEEAHLLSKYRSRLFGRSLSGYHSIGMRSFFRLFNEGVTEKLSREVVAKYIKQVGMTGVITSNIDTFFKMGGGSYEDEVRLIDVIIKRIADDTKVHPDVVWGSIVRGYFRGLNIADINFSNELASSIPINVQEKIARAKTAEDVRRIIRADFSSESDDVTVERVAK